MAGETVINKLRQHLGDLVGLGVATECQDCAKARSLASKINDLPQGVLLWTDAVQKEGEKAIEGKWTIAGGVGVACSSCNGQGLILTAKGSALVDYLRHTILEEATNPVKEPVPF